MSHRPKSGDRFALREAHIRLLKEMEFEMELGDGCEVPSANPKRPYGNSGDQAYEVYRVLNGEEWNDDERGDLRLSSFWEELTTLHAETATALNVILQNLKWPGELPGIYENQAQAYFNARWVRVADLPTLRYFAQLGDGPSLEISKKEFTSHLQVPAGQKQITRTDGENGNGNVTEFLTMSGKLKFWSEVV